MSKRTFLIVRLIGVMTIFATPTALAQTRSLPSTSSLSSLDQRDDDQSSVTVEQQQQQQQQQQSNQLMPLESNQVGHIARSSAGEIGQRQTRDSASTLTGVGLMGRVASRIQNRVQNRLRTRIDRTYDPQADTNDPFRVAQDQIKAINRPR